MTPEEALALTDESIVRGEVVDDAYNYAFWEVVRKALEKQISKKPILKHDTGIMHINNGNRPHEIKKIESDNWHCPVCDGWVGERLYLPFRAKVHDQQIEKFCPKCGQAIDWSEKK